MTPEQHYSPIDACPSFLGSTWDRCLRELPDNLQELAIQYHVVPAAPKSYPHARLTDAHLLVRLILLRVVTHFSLVVVTALAHALGLITFSPVAFHKHLKRAGPFLARVLSLLLLRDRVFRPERWGGFEVVLCDGTTLCRPGARGSTAVVLFALRLPDLAYVDLVIDPDLKAGETFRYYHISQGQLWVADQGLCNPPGIAYVKDHGAEVLVRFNRYALPLYFGPTLRQAVDIYKLVTSVKKPGDVRSWNLWLHPFHHAPISGRLVVVRLPEAQAYKARERLRRSHDGPVTPEDLELAGFFMTYTTAQESRLSAQAVIDLYPLRWQVELQHRRNKSLGGLKRLPDFLPQTIYTWICGHLLAEYLLQKFAASIESVPPDGRTHEVGSKTGCGSRPALATPVALRPIPCFAQHPWQFSVLLWFLLPHLLLPLQALGSAAFFQRYYAHIHRYTTRCSDHCHPRAIERYRMLNAALIRGPPSAEPVANEG